MRREHSGRRKRSGLAPPALPPVGGPSPWRPHIPSGQALHVSRSWPGNKDASQKSRCSRVWGEAPAATSPRTVCGREARR